MSAKEDLEILVKAFPPHVRAEWERQQRVVRAAAAFVVGGARMARGAEAGSDGEGEATLAELKAAVAGLVGRASRRRGARE